MRTFTLLAIALVALAGLAGCTKTGPPNASTATSLTLSPEDEAAVRATLAELDDTWNDHDRKGFHDVFTEEARWVRHSGNVWTSRETMYKYHPFDAETPSLSIENIDVRSVAPHVVVAVAIMKYGEVVLPSGQVNPGWHNRASFVLAKRGDAWKIVHLHKSNLNPIVEQTETR
jgi:uncharacterized protein (TIGR02246 family)